jgi:hypothetical protein
MSTYILRKGRAQLSDLVDGASAISGYPGNYPGRIYYVNNITGSSGASGLSWSDAFSQLSYAVTAAEAYRATFATNNQYVRNVIFIQGTATAYSAVSALPNYCDIIGIGADPRGNGAGIARLDGAGAADAAATAGARGLYIANLQFTGSGAYYAFDAAILFRSIFENCAFMNCATGGLRILTGGGITIRNCHIGGDTTTPATGLTVGNSGGNFNQCLVEDNMIYGSTTGIANSAYLCDGTVFRNNTVYGGTTGVADTSTESTIAGNAFYVNNFCSGTDAMAFTNNGAARVIGNYVVNGTTGAVETTHV